MSDVFISYSRKDKDFVKVLHQALTESKYNTWVDWEDIPLTADWWAEIKAGIEHSHTFLFVISPDSIHSKVCNQELEYAVSQHKRLVPIVRRDGFDTALMHPVLGQHNWLFFREQDDFDVAFASLVKIFNTDLAYVKTHTRLLVRALEWEKHGRYDDFLLRGKDLETSEQWVDSAIQTQQEPLLTNQQLTYIRKSREAENANQRLVAAAGKARRLIRLGSIVFGVTLIGAIVVSFFTLKAFRQLQEAKIATQLERESNYALQKFESAPLQALLLAMRNANNLEALVGDRRPLEHYPTTQPLISLKTILDNIQEHNQIKAHRRTIWSLDTSPSESLIATGSNDGTTRLWDLNGQKRFEIRVKDATFIYVEFSPNGRTLVTNEGNSGFQLWDVATQKRLVTIKSQQPYIYQVSFSPDGQTLASAGSDGSIALWNTKGELLNTIQITSPKLEEFTGFGVSLGWDEADGLIEFSDIFKNSSAQKAGLQAGDRILRINNNSLEGFSRDQAFSLFSGETINLQVLRNDREFEVTLKRATFITENPVAIRTLQFTPDGQYIIAGDTEGVVHFWSSTGRSLPDIQTGNSYIWSLDVSSDGTKLATAGNSNTVKLRDVDSGKVFAELEGHSADVYSVEFSPDGQQVVTSSADGTTRLWNLAGRELAVFRGHQSRVSEARFSNHGDAVITAGRDGTLRIWQLSSLQQDTFWVHGGTVWKSALDPVGELLAIAGDNGTAALWTITGKPVAELKGHQDGVRGISFSRDGQQVATSGEDGTVRLWTRTGKAVSTLQTGLSQINSVEFSPDGKTLLLTSTNAIAKLWDLTSNQQLDLEGHDDVIWDGSFSPDGESIVTASNDGTARLWTRTGKPLAVLRGHQGVVWRAQFSHDGKLITTASGDDTVRLWNLSGELITTLQGHPGGGVDVSFSSDDAYLATVASDGTIYLWNREGQHLSEFGGFEGGATVHFSSNGDQLIAVGQNGTVRILPVEYPSLAELLQRGCNWLQNYFTYSAAADDPDQALCTFSP